MAGIVVASQQNNGFPRDGHEWKDIVEYNKILTLRDEILAGIHPRLGAASQSTGNSIAGSVQPPLPSPPRQPNGITFTKPTYIAKPSNNSLSMSVSANNVLTQKQPQSQQASSSRNGSSGLDPIFLTKSDDLIKAEIRLERQRIERVLEEQFEEKKSGMKLRLSNQEALPEFDVSDVLDKAQDLVKPIAATENSRANGIGSSSDSFDEQTFYSSQFNESATDETDDHSKRHMTKPCKYFFEGSCKKGDACNFSHDPAFNQQLQDGKALTIAVDASDVATSSNIRSGHPNYEVSVIKSGNLSTEARPGAEVAKQKTIRPRDKDFSQSNPPSHAGKDYGDGIEDSMIPPLVMRETDNLNQYARPQHENNLQMQRIQSYQEVDSPTRYQESTAAGKRKGRQSPVFHDGRIVRNHITSPIAPQPARVSPLAIAKVPRVEQVRRNDHDSYSPRQLGHRINAAQSPTAASSPMNTRKRNRGLDTVDTMRNVVARRNLDSPGPFIKEEPVSPPPFTEAPSRRISRETQVRNQPNLYGPTSPRYREDVVRPRRHNDLTDIEILDTPPMSTPLVRRVVSRSGQRYDIQEDTDLRRVVSTRQMRRQISPEQEIGHYSAPTQRSVRAQSQSYIVQPEMDRRLHYRASVQPQQIVYDRPDRSLSPELRHIREPRMDQEVGTMAPPPRRIVVDRYGNQYYEAPILAERRASVAPQARYVSHVVNPFEQNPVRAPSVRPQLARARDEGVYVQRVASPSPPSPRYVEYYPATEPTRTYSRQRAYESNDEGYRERNDILRVVNYPQQRAEDRFAELPGPREGVSRMQSVRPSDVQYEGSREHVPRYQTVQPDHERIIELSGRREVSSSAIRPVSVRADERYERPPAYVTSEQPRYQYLPNGRNSGYIEGEVPGELVVETPRRAARL